MDTWGILKGDELKWVPLNQQYDNDDRTYLCFQTTGKIFINKLPHIQLRKKKKRKEIKFKISPLLQFPSLS